MELIVVGDPNLIDNVGKKILMENSNRIFEKVIDFDLSSLYPSIIIAFNISPDTCYGRIQVKKEGTEEIITEEFMDDLMSKDYINFGEKWYKLPSVSNMYEYLSSKYNNL